MLHFIRMLYHFATLEYHMDIIVRVSMYNTWTLDWTGLWAHSSLTCAQLKERKLQAIIVLLLLLFIILSTYDLK